MKPIALLFGVLMLVGVSLVPMLTLRPTLGSAIAPQLDTLIPEEIGPWRMAADVQAMMPVADVQSQIELTFDQLVQRSYVNAQGQRIMLVVGYGGNQAGTLKAHRQEVCYSAQGAEIRGLRQERLPLAGANLPVTRMLAVTPNRMEPVTYWLTLGGRVANSPWEWLLAQLHMGLRGEPPHGLLVRVSNLSPDAGQSFHLHDRFIAELLGRIPVVERWRFTGLAGD